MVENFSVGSSVTYNNDADPPNITINPTADLARDTVYAISYPSGAFTQSGAGGSFVGTGYTFYTTSLKDHTLWSWGYNSGTGAVGDNSRVNRSSPVQLGSSYWIDIYNAGAAFYGGAAIKENGTLWAWGDNWQGQLGQNTNGGDWPAWSGAISSPVQIGSDTTWGEGTTSLGNKTHLSVGYAGVGCIKTDGTLWMWGNNPGGKLGQNDTASRSSPAQVPGTTWKQIVVSYYSAFAIKTDGTLWSWGDGNGGALAQNSTVKYSSPVQIPGTTWDIVDSVSDKGCAAIKTDGTMWAWGRNNYGQLGINDRTDRSSPVQIPGTTWSNIDGSGSDPGALATRTDGTLWSWGYNAHGRLGQNNITSYSSPVQIPGTDWAKTDRKKLSGGALYSSGAIKTDGTFWTWGKNNYGQLGKNSVVNYSSPVQVPGTNYISISGHHNGMIALRES